MEADGEEEVVGKEIIIGVRFLDEEGDEVSWRRKFVGNLAGKMADGGGDRFPCSARCEFCSRGWHEPVTLSIRC